MDSSTELRRLSSSEEPFQSLYGLRISDTQKQKLVSHDM